MFAKVIQSSLAAVLVIFSIQAQSLEVLKSYKDLKIPNDGKKTWYIFDIDNTLLRPSGSVGSVEWVESMKTRYEAAGLSTEAALEKQHELFGLTQALIMPMTIEHEEISMLGKLARSGQVIALTARNKNLQQTTLKQLDFAGLRFAFQLNPVVLTARPISFTYEQGIVFATGQDKGSILETMLATTLQVPERIIFFDDKDYNVLSLEKAMAKVNQNRPSKIEFVGYHYTAADKQVKSLDTKIADIEWYNLKYLGSANSNPLISAESLAFTLMSKSIMFMDQAVTNYNCQQSGHKTENGKDLVIMSCEYYVCDSWVYDSESDYCMAESLSEQKYEFTLEYLSNLGIYIRQGWDLFN